ncbi:hypothetical protein [Chakrabartyella piscis]|uniref:hypothetical protein n=1 Tax=Chakrabartyella piscis TaxID=2918914 RepID=UPI002958860D|nr:hypothetical protein [Chakrabartyella piscis]
MKKLTGMYQAFCKERHEEFENYINGGDTMGEIQNFLKQKLNADDFYHAEELLNALVSEIEEKGFKEGAKYTSGLAKELFTE